MLMSTTSHSAQAGQAMERTMKDSCGTSAMPNISEPLELEDYDISKDPLGRGSMGAIHYGIRRTIAAIRKGNPEEIVLKVSDCQESGDKDDGNSSLTYEASILERISQHPNIVGFFGICDVTISDGLLSKAIQLEYCSGGDLYCAVSRRRLDEAEACDMMRHVLGGLRHMHALGVVHRDVKPENILLSSDGIAKLADFGISALLSDPQAMSKRCGSPGYAAPEVLLGKEYGIKVDSFGAGCVLHYAISGKVAFAGGDLNAILKRTVTRPVNIRRSVCLQRLSNGCKSFLEMLLEKNPENRPTADEALSKMSWPAELCAALLGDASHESKDVQISSLKRTCQEAIPPIVTGLKQACAMSCDGEDSLTSSRRRPSGTIKSSPKGSHTRPRSSSESTESTACPDDGSANATQNCEDFLELPEFVSFHRQSHTWGAAWTSSVDSDSLKVPIDGGDHSRTSCSSKSSSSKGTCPQTVPESEAIMLGDSMHTGHFPEAELTGRYQSRTASKPLSTESTMCPDDCYAITTQECEEILALPEFVGSPRRRCTTRPDGSACSGKLQKEGNACSASPLRPSLPKSGQAFARRYRTGKV
jgi:serine/threonine protein kinase